jgi:uncharacterized PurR-regulated membrane protein YhhQ (DUF165 family)
MKILTGGRWLWSRTIGSTIIGQGLDTAIFISLAYAGTGSPIATMILHHWFVKTAIEIVFTPITYIIVNSLKKVEGLDYYDHKISYNPFKIFEKR